MSHGVSLTFDGNAFFRVGSSANGSFRAEAAFHFNGSRDIKDGTVARQILLRVQVTFSEFLRRMGTGCVRTVQSGAPRHAQPSELVQGDVLSDGCGIAGIAFSCEIAVQRNVVRAFRLVDGWVGASVCFFENGVCREYLAQEWIG